MDAGHDEIDGIIDLMEQDVKELYNVAAADLQAKVSDYWRRYNLKNDVKSAQLQAGEITKQEYIQWQTGQLLIGQRWEEQLNVITQDLLNAHNIAESIVNGYLPDVFALSHNYGSYEIDMLLQGATNNALSASKLGLSYTLYDRDTVIRLMRDKPEILPALNPRSEMARKIAEGKVIQWEKKQVTSELLQGIMQGESNVDIAARMRKITNADWKSTMRYARTATTNTECAGRIESYKRAQKAGIELEQQWVATLDQRTRHSHRQLDGQHIPVGSYFEVPDDATGNIVRIKYPGQFSSPNDEYKVPPDMIWNCRCTIVAMLTGIPELDEEGSNDLSNLEFRNAEKLEGMSYEEWKKGYGKSDPILKAKKIGEARKAQAIKEYREAAKRTGGG